MQIEFLCFRILTRIFSCVREGCQKLVQLLLQDQRAVYQLSGNKLKAAYGVFSIGNVPRPTPL